MADKAFDEGVIKALLDRLNQQRLPQMLEIQQRVNRGEKLNELDIVHLQEISESAGQIKPMLERHPEYKPLVARVISLYEEITSRALQNEKQA